MNNCVVEVEYEYVVLKINGYDISHLPRYEAVQKFLQAKETLVVELCRQKHNELDLMLEPDANTKLSDVDKIDPILQVNTCEPVFSTLLAKPVEAAPSASTRTASASQQVDSTPSTIPAASEVITTKNPVILTLRALSHEERSGRSGVFAASKETQTHTSIQTDVLKDHDIVQTLTDHFIEQEHHLFEQCLEPEIDIEEVTLIKAVENANSDQIGLLVCSSGFQSTNIDTNKCDVVCNDSEHCEDVFISGIQPESIAHRDGRLRQGDQILRVNVQVQYEYDESEHIYETIPEDSESEPLYCSPYQSSNGKTSMGSCSSALAATPAEALETTMQQQTQRVAQWLGLKPHYPRAMHTLVANRCHESTSSKRNSGLPNGENGDEIPMVWKVKRRPDGTRYIVKRPVRNRHQIAIRKNMRCNELTTTEEDTVSEVKIGRYWTKEERKRHIERARERRHNQTQQQ
ncbi:hypothetical protein M5D96_010768 [Drosophila gunungcola]|uniref:PDZ domain-containing protein n=1 Tax=Drosophila gunungcola TaxID=103775 RepID=A0A9P9YGE6_9MUSC|nr:hypothetical protein M5D96_010768 [Drosophila gunungcola]